jgi:phage terminase small subunit
MADNLTQKQEAFCLAYIETGNAAEAYRRAYDVRAATLHSSIYVNASKLMADAKIKQRVRELQAEAAETALYTKQKAFEEYEAARQLALQVENPSAAVAAVTGKVKLFGMDAPSKFEHGGPDGAPLTPPVIQVIAVPSNATSPDQAT